MCKINNNNKNLLKNTFFINLLIHNTINIR